MPSTSNVDVGVDDDDSPLWSMDDELLDSFVLGYEPSILVWMVCGLVTMLCSIIIFRESMKDFQNMGQVRNRPISLQYASMSVAYGLFGLVGLLGPIPAPSSTDLFLTSGNIGTCSTQAFLLFLSLYAASMLNGSAGVMYMLIVRYNWSDEQLWRVMKLINSLSWLVAAALAILPIPFKFYNFNGYRCALEAFPPGCTNEETVYSNITNFTDLIAAQHQQQQQEGQPCVRGTDDEFLEIFYMLELGIFAVCCIVFITSFTLIYCSVWRVENKISKYAGTSRRPDSQRSSVNSRQARHGMRAVLGSITSVGNGDGITTATPINRSKSNQVAIQASLLGSLFFTAFILYTAAIFSGEPHITFVSQAFGNLQGLFISIVFVRLRKTMKTPEGRLFRKLVCCIPCRGVADLAGGGGGSVHAPSARKSHSSILRSVQIHSSQARSDRVSELRMSDSVFEEEDQAADMRFSHRTGQRLSTHQEGDVESSREIEFSREMEQSREIDRSREIDLSEIFGSDSDSEMSSDISSSQHENLRDSGYFS